MMLLATALLVLSAPPDVPSGEVLLHQSFQRDDGTLEHASVYLPHGYSEDTDTRYPLLLLLHGLGGDDEGWFAGGYLVDILDRAIASGRIQPMVVVIPDGGNGYWTNWATEKDSRYASLVEPATRRWAQRRFRTDERVAIGGISMGGFGALSIALQHPRRYAAVLSFSGALFRALPTGRSVYMKAFGYPGLRQARFSFFNPIDLARFGRADDETIWLDCGAGDKDRFAGGLREMSRVLTSRGVRHVARFRPGRHSWDVWLAGLEEALPWLNTAFENASLRNSPVHDTQVTRHGGDIDSGIPAGHVRKSHVRSPLFPPRIR